MNNDEAFLGLFKEFKETIQTQHETILEHEAQLRVAQSIITALCQQLGVDKERLLAEADAHLGSQYDRLAPSKAARKAQTAAMVVLRVWLPAQEP